MLAVFGTLAVVLLIIALVYKFTSVSSTSKDDKGKKDSKGKKQQQKKPTKQVAAKKDKMTPAAAAAPAEEDEEEADEEVPTTEPASPAPKASNGVDTKKGNGAEAKKGKQLKGSDDAKKGKGKKDNAKFKAAAVPEPEVVQESIGTVQDMVPVIMDTGDGDAWEVAATGPKKSNAKLQRMQEDKEAKAAKAEGFTKASLNHIPGMAPPGAAEAQAKKEKEAAAQAKAQLKLTPEQEKAAAADGAAMKTLSVTVDEKMIGRIIGPKGATLKLIQEKTEVTKIDTNGEVFTIMGPPKACLMAEAAIKELCEKGFCSLMYEDFNQAFVMVHPSMFPDLIGKQGAIVRQIKEQLKVEISFPQTPPVDPEKKIKDKKKYKVTLAGRNEDVQKAKEVINDIITVHHHELTHPGFVHENIEVEDWQLSYIIGTKGSEIKHIQANYKVKVYTPNESGEPTSVVGEPHNVKRACSHMEKLLWNAANKPRGRGADVGYEDDGWGGEEEVEDWMKGYLFNRKR